MKGRCETCPPAMNINMKVGNWYHYLTSAGDDFAYLLLGKSSKRVVTLIMFNPGSPPSWTASGSIHRWDIEDFTSGPMKNRPHVHIEYPYET